MPVATKICGITREDAVHAVNNAKADYAGFVYFPASPRHLKLERAAELKSKLSPAVKTVSVLVDPDDALLAQVSSILKPDYIQLHGKETPQRLQQIRSLYPRMKIIKGISVRTSDDVARSMPFSDAADMFLFDAKPPEAPNMLPGGNGLSFDWNLLSGRQFSKPWMLSGGLNAENVAEAIRLSGAQMVDVSSSVESAPGVKDPALIEQFVKAACQ